MTDDLHVAVFVCETGDVVFVCLTTRMYSLCSHVYSYVYISAWIVCVFGKVHA